MNNALETSTPAETSATLQQIPLSKIIGVHSVIERLFQELSVPPFRVLAKNALSEQQISHLLDIFPIRIVRDRKHLRCTGNIRLYQLGIQYLSPSQSIPCLTENPLTDKVLQDRAVQELLLAPAALGVRFSDIKLLAALARRANAAEKLTAEPLVDDAYMAKLYDVDIRQLRDKANTPPDTQKPSSKHADKEE